MADPADHASEQIEAHLADARAAQSARATPASAPSARCIDCDEAIPADRLRAVPGCCRCVECQALEESL